MSISLNLFFNLSLLVAISVISAFITDKTRNRKLLYPVLQGLLFGATAMIGIHFPVVLSPGVIFDGRSVVLSICGLFFGPVSGAIAAAMAIIMRIALGGGGTMMGILVILSSVSIGVFFYYRWGKNQTKLNFLKLYMMGILVHVVMIGLMLTLPWEVAMNSLRKFSLPVLTLYPLATLIIGKILEDNFDRIRAHKELVLQKERAELSNSLKDIFIATISHEIRTPLNAILGFASIIEDEASDRFTEDEKVYFQRINQSGLRLTRTVDEILNYSRLLVKDLKLKLISIDIPLLTEKLIREGKFNHPNHPALVVFDNSAGAFTMDLDEFCLRTTLSQLLDNAFKYTESGTITVKIFHDKYGRICISISDMGIGISEEFMNKIFEPYSQEATGYTRRYEGIGLGLSIVKRLCEIMKAEISVESQKGIGSCFTVTFHA